MDSYTNRYLRLFRKDDKVTFAFNGSQDVEQPHISSVEIDMEMTGEDKYLMSKYHYELDGYVIEHGVEPKYALLGLKVYEAILKYQYFRAGGSLNFDDYNGVTLLLMDNDFDGITFLRDNQSKYTGIKIFMNRGK